MVTCCITVVIVITVTQHIVLFPGKKVAMPENQIPFGLHSEAGERERDGYFLKTKYM